ncbi:hypothetical protein GCM10011492_40030 [Flexivirga endophytica]|uniref:N-acetyltransferase domain-containing protein n=1 Tax=Flexivirga endophytica TaxID=1849103 RepID=A0A916TK05_9MICO|nr:GNAT family N-acetyltransferase [Flexivirga endophytica]GGB44922.1 hypothetical protein GCM10011492_40030 [Flexivirga endophytica]GHB68814.1 hypothetical protein GCM10008112_41930 [Flexivirga endophytica]
MPVDRALDDAAREVAASYARRSGVDVRRLQSAETQEACDLLAQIWASGRGRVPIEASLLVALLHSDNYVAGAFDGTRLVGVCVGFFTSPGQAGLHSHIAGVRRTHVGRGVGVALKLHQRAWAIGNGITTISWTYDPLVARNAYFNLHRLGARAIDYVPDFYGDMSDGLNDGHGSDRMVTRWDLAVWPPDHSAMPVGPPALELGRAREPVRITVPADAQTCRVAVPDDIGALRLRDVDLAVEWRRTTRDVLTDLIGSGWSISGFARAGFYSLERTPAHGTTR